MNWNEKIPAMAGLASVTGYETQEAAKLDALMTGFDEALTDAVGNRIFVRRCGRSGAPRILIDTHFDEIGLFVTDVAEQGFLRVTRAGGVDLRTLPSADVRIYGKQTITGVIASTPPHLQKPDEEKKLLPADELLVDTGYPSEELKQLVRPGTPVGFAPHYFTVAHDRIVGKGLDNKACCAVAAAALAEIPAAELAGDVYLLFAVHEETDLLGGTVAGGYRVAPDYAMVIDVNLGRTPNTKKSETVLLGKGPSITRSAATDRRLTKMTEDLATRESIPWQISVCPAHTGTDAVSLHLTGAGIPVVDVGLPLRAMHTYVEMIDPADAEQLARLVRAFVCDREIAEVYYENGN